MGLVLRKNFTIAVALFFCLHALSAQETKLFNGKRHRIGCIAGAGAQDLNGIFKLTYPREVALDVTYNYRVIFFQAQYYYALLRKKTWGIDILAQPQYNVTTFRPSDNRAEEIRGYEFGLNGGILIRKNFFKDFLSIYAFISSGPHYVSGVPERQSKGFIFSDNFFVGLNVKLLEDVYLDLRPGFRHISNAGLTEQNGGVNNLVFSGGFLVNL